MPGLLEELVSCLAVSHPVPSDPPPQPGPHLAHLLLLLRHRGRGILLWRPLPQLLQVSMQRGPQPCPVLGSRDCWRTRVRTTHRLAPRGPWGHGPLSPSTMRALGMALPWFSGVAPCSS